MHIAHGVTITRMMKFITSPSLCMSLKCKISQKVPKHRAFKVFEIDDISERWKEMMQVFLSHRYNIACSYKSNSALAHCRRLTATHFPMSVGCDN